MKNLMLTGPGMKRKLGRIEDFPVKDYAERVKYLRDAWTERQGFFTLGAAAYLDRDYRELAHQVNPVIWHYFPDLLQDIKTYFDGEYDLTIGLPGFHIFDKQSNGLVGSIHVDTPWAKIWGRADDVFSFTLPLELPSFGGGLNWWDEGMHFMDYEIGKLYIHDGATYHQIASLGDMAEDEYRITLQGHGATVGNRKYLYF